MGRRLRSGGFLKGATNKQKADYMNMVLDFRKDLTNLAENPPDRHIALTEIKAIMGSENFNNWFNKIYKLRDQNRQAEYVTAIFAKLDELKKCNTQFIVSDTEETEIP